MAPNDDRAPAATSPQKLPTEIIQRIFQLRIQVNNNRPSILAYADTLHLATISHWSFAITMAELTEELLRIKAADDEIEAELEEKVYTKDPGNYIFAPSRLKNGMKTNSSDDERELAWKLCLELKEYDDASAAIRKVLVWLERLHQMLQSRGKCLETWEDHRSVAYAREVDRLPRRRWWMTEEYIYHNGT